MVLVEVGRAVGVDDARADARDEVVDVIDEPLVLTAGRLRGVLDLALAEFEEELATHESALEIGIEIHPEVVIQTSGLSYGEVFYEEGYSRAQELVKKGLDFTALYAYNDISAIGAIPAFVPVTGFT